MAQVRRVGCDEGWWGELGMNEEGGEWERREKK